MYFYNNITIRTQLNTMSLSTMKQLVHSSLSDMNLPEYKCNRTKDPLINRLVNDLVRKPLGRRSLLQEKKVGPQQRQINNFFNNHPNTNFDQEKAMRRYFCGESGEKYFNLWNKCRLMLNKLNAADDTFAIVMVVLAVNTHINVKSAEIQELVVNAIEANKVVANAENDVAKAYIAKEKVSDDTKAEAEVLLNEKKATLKEKVVELRDTVMKVKTINVAAKAA